MERGRLRSGLEGARKRLAVDRNDLPGKPHRAPQALRKGGREAAEDRLERLRVEQAEHAAEGVVTGNAVAQPQQGAKQRLLRAPEQGHVAAGLGAAERCREGDDQHVHELVTGVAGARVGQPRKGRFQALQGKSPGSILDTSENPKRAALPAQTSNAIPLRLRERGGVRGDGAGPHPVASGDSTSPAARAR